MRSAVTSLLGGAIGIAVFALPLGVMARRAQTIAPEPLAPIVRTTAMAILPVVQQPEPEPILPHTWRVADLDGEAGVELKDGKVGKRTMMAALLGSGMTAKEAMRVLHAFDRVHKLDRCSASDSFQWARKNARIIAFEYLVSPAEVWQARENEKGDLETKKLDLVVSHKRVSAGIALNGDLRNAIGQAGLHDALAAEVDEALAAHVDLGTARTGSRLRVIATEEKIEGRFSRYSEVLAVELLMPSKDPLRLYGYKVDKTIHYYDAKGRAPYRGAWRAPVPGARISSRFDMHRLHPVLHTVMPHNGVDFASPSGTPVYAAASGTVKTVGDGGPCGNMVQIEHPANIVSSYCHLSRFGPVHVGDHIEQRQLVGYVGQTGRATGPHLHFAVKRGEMFIDPLSMKLDGVHVLPPKDRDDFEDFKDDMDEALDAIALPDAPTDTSPDTPSSGEGDTSGDELDE